LSSGNDHPAASAAATPAPATPTAGRTFIIPGELVHLARMRSVLSDEVCGILIHKNISEEAARAADVVPPTFADKLFTLRSLEQPTHAVLDEREQADYARCLAHICADPRAHYLATRTYFNSAFNNTIVIERMVLNTLLLVRRTRPARLVSSSTPHSIGAWVFATCFELLGLPVFVLERTPINDRAWIYRGLDTQKVVLRHEPPAAALGASSMKLLKEQRGGEPGARDANGFYLSRMDLSSIKGADSNAWWSTGRELGFLRSGRLVSLPVRLASFWLKRRLLQSYHAACTSGLPQNPFVVYFMHYQPERSSLPEGLFFVQQWLVIRLLSWALPAGWTLIVREHPSMWLNPLDITVRTPGLYGEIAALPNVKICSMELDTFELIDKSRAVATLTGSVGFQALLRNRPVLAFGLPAYKDHPACFSVSTLEQVREALQAVQGGSIQERFTDEALTRYLHWVEANSYCVDPAETDWLEARLKNFTDIYARILSHRVSLQ